MKDRISALLDGELDEAEARRLIGRLKAEPELRRTWDEYHCVGDVLRGHLGPGLCAGVAARLACEPTVLSRRSSAPSAKSAQRVGRWALTVAAGLAAVVLVAWMALPARGPSSQIAQTPAAIVPSAPANQPFQEGGVPATPLDTGPQVASAPRFVSGQISARAVAEANARAQAEALSALGMRNYLLAHQRFSPSSAMQGVAPYARTVASEGDER
jgi:sigma-E factor negative regulatory protein RseA